MLFTYLFNDDESLLSDTMYLDLEDWSISEKVKDQKPFLFFYSIYSDKLGRFYQTMQDF